MDTVSTLGEENPVVATTAERVTTDARMHNSINADDLTPLTPRRHITGASQSMSKHKMQHSRGKALAPSQSTGLRVLAPTASQKKRSPDCDTESRKKRMKSSNTVQPIDVGSIMYE